MRKTLALWLAKGMKTTDLYEIRRDLMKIADHKLEVKFGLDKTELARG